MRNKYSLKEKTIKKDVSTPKKQTIQNLLHFSKSFEVLKKGSDLLSVNLN